MTQRNYMDRIGEEQIEVPRPRNEDDVCEDVGQRINLIAPEMKAAAEHFNGVLNVDVGRYHFLVGTTNEYWGADVYDIKDLTEGRPLDGITSTVHGEETDLDKVANAVIKMIRRYINAQEFLAKLNEFKCAAFELNEVWQKLDKSDHAAGSVCKVYPFKESFDETVLAIEAWEEQVTNDPSFGK